MAYEFAYRTNTPKATTDGSGMVQHLITAVYREEGEQDWEIVPGQSKTFNLPYTDVKTVMDMSNGAAKNQAYKQLLVDNIDTLPTPLTGWSDTLLNQKVTINAAVLVETNRVIDYVEVTLNKTFPLEFDL